MTVSPVDIFPAPCCTRVVSTPAADSRSNAIFPRGSDPIFEINPTCVPSEDKLWAKIPDELPSVRATSLANNSASDSRSFGSPYRTKSRLSSPTTQTLFTQYSLLYYLERNPLPLTNEC